MGDQSKQMTTNLHYTTHLTVEQNSNEMLAKINGKMSKFEKIQCPTNATVTLCPISSTAQKKKKKKITNTSSLRGIDTFPTILSDFQNRNT